MLGNIFHRNVMAAQRKFMRGGGMALNKGVTPSIAAKPDSTVGGPRKALLGRGAPTP